MGRRSDHTRPQIRAMAIDAARDIVATEGYRALSARNVARRIGYAAGTLYVVFENLDELVLILNAESLEDLGAKLGGALRAESIPARRPRAVAEAYVEFALRNTQRWRMIFEHQLAPDRVMPQSIQDRSADLLRLLATALRPLTPARSEDDIAELATALWSGVHGICILALTERLPTATAASLPRLVGMLVDQFTTGLRASD